MFEDAYPDTLNNAGTARLDKIGLALCEHADTRIYIEEYVPVGNETAGLVHSFTLRIVPLE